MVLLFIKLLNANIFNAISISFRRQKQKVTVLPDVRQLNTFEHHHSFILVVCIL